MAFNTIRLMKGRLVTLYFLKKLPPLVSKNVLKKEDWL